MYALLTQQHCCKKTVRLRDLKTGVFEITRFVREVVNFLYLYCNTVPSKVAVRYIRKSPRD